MLVIALIRSQRAATAEMILAADEGKCAPKRAGVWERTEVARAIVLFDAGEGETRDRVVEINFDEKKAFVVAKADVVARMKFFDEFAFQEEGFGFAANDVIIKIVNAVDERAEFEVPTHATGGLEVLRDAFAQVAGFADVNDSAEAVAHQVDARLVREIAKLLLDIVEQRHASNK